MVLLRQSLTMWRFIKFYDEDSENFRNCNAAYRGWREGGGYEVILGGGRGVIGVHPLNLSFIFGRSRIWFVWNNVC